MLLVKKKKNCNVLCFLLRELDPHEKWYCKMNPDEDHNTCAVPEEHSCSSKPYAYGLECGELVWGKLAGWTP